MYKPLELPPCRICDGEASGIHYGVNTCEACKAFFRRAVMEKDKYHCVKDGNCKIIDRKRGNCSYCRLQKCLALGMSRSAMRHGRYTVAIRTKTILEVKQLNAQKQNKSNTSEGTNNVNSTSIPVTENFTFPQIPKPHNSFSSTSSSLSENSFTSSTSSSVSDSSFQNYTIPMSDNVFHNSTSPVSIPDQSVTSSAQFSLAQLDDPDVASLFDDLSSTFIESESSSSLEDLTETFLDQSESSFDFLQEVNATLQNETPAIETQNIPSPTRKSARIAEKRRSTLQEVKLDDDPWLSTLDQDFFTDSEAPMKKLRPNIREYEMEVEDMEQMIWTLIWSQDQIYPELMASFDKDHMKKIHIDYSEKFQLKKKVFGLDSMLSNEEFNNFYLATGIDVDGRLEMLKKAIENIQRIIVKYISFARIIPGFEDLCTEDKLSLIKAARFEYWLLGNHRYINSELKVIYYPEMQSQLTRDDIIMMFGEEEAVDQALEFCSSLQKLRLSYEEMAVLQAIIITFRDRCTLKNPEKVEAIQWKLIQCLKYLIEKFHKKEPHRFSAYIDKLITLRELTEVNRRVNRKMEHLHMSIIKQYPLVYECLSHDLREGKKEEEEKVTQLDFLTSAC